MKPKLLASANIEAFPDLVPAAAVIHHDRAGVVQLVCQGHFAEWVPLMADPLNVGPLTLKPRRLLATLVVRRLIMRAGQA